MLVTSTKARRRFTPSYENLPFDTIKELTPIAPCDDGAFLLIRRDRRCRRRRFRIIDWRGHPDKLKFVAPLETVHQSSAWTTMYEGRGRYCIKMWNEQGAPPASGSDGGHSIRALPARTSVDS